MNNNDFEKLGRKVGIAFKLLVCLFIIIGIYFWHLAMGFLLPMVHADQKNQEIIMNIHKKDFNNKNGIYTNQSGIGFKILGVEDDKLMIQIINNSKVKLSNEQLNDSDFYGLFFVFGAKNDFNNKAVYTDLLKEKPINEIADEDEKNKMSEWHYMHVTRVSPTSVPDTSDDISQLYYNQNTVYKINLQDNINMIEISFQFKNSDKIYSNYILLNNLK